MKIGYISADFGVPIFGFKGASIHVREMVSAFRRAGHDIHIVSPAMQAGKGSEAQCDIGRFGLNEIPEDARALFTLSENMLQKPGDIFFNYVLPGDFHLQVFNELNRFDTFWGTKTRIKQELRNQLYNLVLFEETFKYFQENTVDFIYERYSLFAFAGIKLARELKVPHILEVNAPLAYEQEKMRGLEMKNLALVSERRIYRETDCVFVVSQELKNYVISCGVPEERITVLPNGVDPKRFVSASDGNRIREKFGLTGKRTIGFVGSLKSWHGTDMLCKAFYETRKQTANAHLLIVGDGPERNTLENYVSKYDLQKAVTFTGKIPYPEIPEYIAAMDITVAPYIPNDNFYFSPIKIFEYMAMGKPVVAGRIGQVEDLLIEGKNGLMFPPGDTLALTNILVKLVNDPDSCKEMGGHGKNWVLAERTWDRNGAEVLESLKTHEIH